MRPRRRLREPWKKRRSKRKRPISLTTQSTWKRTLLSKRWKRRRARQKITRNIRCMRLQHPPNLRSKGQLKRSRSLRLWKGKRTRRSKKQKLKKKRKPRSKKRKRKRKRCSTPKLGAMARSMRESKCGLPRERRDSRRERHDAEWTGKTADAAGDAASNAAANRSL